MDFTFQSNEHKVANVKYQLLRTHDLCTDKGECSNNPQSDFTSGLLRSLVCVKLMEMFEGAIVRISGSSVWEWKDLRFVIFLCYLSLSSAASFNANASLYISAHVYIFIITFTSL